MTWILMHSDASLPEWFARDAEKLFAVKLRGEWSDSEIEEAARKVKRAIDAEIDPFCGDDTYKILKDFLPQPVREAL